MTLPLRRVFVFGVQFLAAFVVFLALSPLIVPPYQRALVGFGNAVLSGVSSPSSIESRPDGGVRYMVRLRGGARGELMHFDAQGLALSQLNLVLLPSLLLATPLPPVRRVRLLGSGLVLLVVLQALTTITWAPVTRCLAKDSENLFCGALFYVMIAGGQVYSVAIWGLLTWRYWFRELVGPSGP